MTSDSRISPKALLVGASRGLGLAIAGELLGRNWDVVGTVRQTKGTGLHRLANTHPGRIAIEILDITKREQIFGLKERLKPDHFDMLFVNAGAANEDQDETISEVSDDEFVRVMLTNALGVMRTVEGLEGMVRSGGLIGVMSSGQGSIQNNNKGGHEVYRGSKAALNQYMRSYAARRKEDGTALVLMAPGWIRTELGGPKAPFSVEEVIPQLVTTLIEQQGSPGLRFIDRFGDKIPW